MPRSAYASVRKEAIVLCIVAQVKKRVFPNFLLKHIGKYIDEPVGLIDSTALATTPWLL
jgi:hypothetical protein